MSEATEITRAGGRRALERRPALLDARGGRRGRSRPDRALLLADRALFRHAGELSQDLRSDRDQHRARLGHDHRHPDRRHRPFGGLGAGAVHGRRRADHDRQGSAVHRLRSARARRLHGRRLALRRDQRLRRRAVEGSFLHRHARHAQRRQRRGARDEQQLDHHRPAAALRRFRQPDRLGRVSLDLPDRGRGDPDRLVHPALHGVRPFHLRHRHQRGGGAGSRAMRRASTRWPPSPSAD